MRLILQLALCGCLAAGVALAQRGGGGHGGGGGGGMHGGGFSGGGMRVSGGGSYGGGVRTTGGYAGAYHGGGYSGGAYHGGGYGHGGYGHGGYYRGGYYGYRGYYGYYGWGWPYWYYPYGWGFGYSYPGYSYPAYYDSGYYDGYSYPSYTNTYPAYQPASNVTVVYPQTAQSAPSSVYVNPNLRTYDEYGQEQAQPSAGGGGSSGAPIYLIAFRDQSIRAAVAYWVEGRTLHYVTTQHEERQSSLDAVDRDTSLRLNRERRVPFSLPAQ